MKIILTILLAVTLGTTTPDLVGVYEYKSIEKSENHYIVFDKVDGELKGKYFGTHDGKGHGVFFYKADIKNLNIGAKGEIEFEIGDRLLYAINQFKIKDPEPDSIIGTTREVLKYTGQVTENKIKLVCASEFNDCWERQLTFDKVSNGR